MVNINGVHLLLLSVFKITQNFVNTKLRKLLILWGIYLQTNVHTIILAAHIFL